MNVGHQTFIQSSTMCFMHVLRGQRKTEGDWQAKLLQNRSLLVLGENSFKLIVQFQKISILPPWKVFCLMHPPRSKFQFSLSSYFPSKILAFKTPPPPRNSQ